MSEKVWYEVETKEHGGWLNFPRRHESLTLAVNHLKNYVANPESRIVKVTETREVVE